MSSLREQVIVVLQLKEHPTKDPFFLHVHFILQFKPVIQAIHIGFVSTAQGDFIQHEEYRTVRLSIKGDIGL